MSFRMIRKKRRIKEKTSTQGMRGEKATENRKEEDKRS